MEVLSYQENEHANEREKVRFGARGEEWEWRVRRAEAEVEDSGGREGGREG